MNRCSFCAGDRIFPDQVGEGTKTMAMMMGMLLGDLRNGSDGIRLVNKTYLAFDNSAGEYAEEMVEIKYCPMCGRELGLQG